MAPAVSEWSVDEVLAMLDGLGLSHLQQPFRENGVNGRLLVTMHETEFMEVGSAHRVNMGRTDWPDSVVPPDARQAASSLLAQSSALKRASAILRC